MEYGEAEQNLNLRDRHSKLNCTHIIMFIYLRPGLKHGIQSTTFVPKYQISVINGSHSSIIQNQIGRNF